MKVEFKECSVCADKYGCERLCESCIHNRKQIIRLRAINGELSKYPWLRFGFGAVLGASVVIAISALLARL